MKTVRVKQGDKVIAKPMPFGGKSTFTVAVIGNYTPEAIPLLKGPLTRVLVSSAQKVLGKRADTMVVVHPPQPTALGAFTALVARSLRIPVVLQEFPDEDAYNKVDLVIKVKLTVAGDENPARAEELEQQFDASVDAWAGNDKVYELPITLPAHYLKDKTPAHLLTRKAEVGLPPDTNNYSEFVNKIDQYRQSTVQEVEPTHDRSQIPAYGPGVLPNTNMAGGLAQS